MQSYERASCAGHPLLWWVPGALAFLAGWGASHDQTQALGSRLFWLFRNRRFSSHPGLSPLLLFGAFTDLVLGPPAKLPHRSQVACLVHLGPWSPCLCSAFPKQLFANIEVTLTKG